MTWGRVGADMRREVWRREVVNDRRGGRGASGAGIQGSGMQGVKSRSKCALMLG